MQMFVDEIILPYFVLHSVPLSEVEDYIIGMEESFYTLTYISSHSVNSSIHYSMIFKYNPGVEFVTIMFARLKELKRTIASYEADGYQLTLIYNMMNSIEHIAVLEKITHIHSHEYRLNAEKHHSVYKKRSSQGNSLLSTTIALTGKGAVRYTSIYSQENVTNRHMLNVSSSKLLKRLDKQFNRGFYLTHLTSIPTNPPSYSVVFHKMTKTTANYVMSKKLEINEVKEFVEMQVDKGFIPLVVTGLDTKGGLKFVVSFEK